MHQPHKVEGNWVINECKIYNTEFNLTLNNYSGIMPSNIFITTTLPQNREEKNIDNDNDQNISV